MDQRPAAGIEGEVFPGIAQALRRDGRETGRCENREKDREGRMRNKTRILEQKITEKTAKYSFPSVISVCSCSILCLLFVSFSALAHEVRPAYLELRQTGAESY